MGAFFAIGSEAIAGPGVIRFSVTSFTDFLDGGAVIGSPDGTEADRWETAHFPMTWTCAGGALAGGQAIYPTRWVGSGGAKVGGAALYPLRIVPQYGAVAGGAEGGATENPPSGGGVVSGYAIYGYWFGMHLAGGGGVVGGQAEQGWLLHSDVMLQADVTNYGLTVTSSAPRFTLTEV